MDITGDIASHRAAIISDHNMNPTKVSIVTNMFRDLALVVAHWAMGKLLAFGTMTKYGRHFSILILLLLLTNFT
jgi:hypothetical protein